MLCYVWPTLDVSLPSCSVKRGSWRKASAMPYSDAWQRTLETLARFANHGLLESYAAIGDSSMRKLIHLGKARRAVPVVLGVLTLSGVGILFAWDLFPRLFSAGAHRLLASLPLAMIAFAYLIYQ